MIYSDPTNKQGILDLARYHVKADSNKLPETLGRIFINEALDDYLELALFSSGFWSVDDPNHGDESNTDIALVSGTSMYAFPSDLLTLEKVELKDGAGNWTELVVKGVPDHPTNLQVNTTGIPMWCYAQGNYLHLFPTPNYSQAASLRLWHTRAFVYWDGTDTNVPGIPTVHHKYLALRTAYLYAVRENLRNAKAIGELMLIEQQRITQFYSRRNKPVKKRLRVAVTPSF